MIKYHFTAAILLIIAIPCLSAENPQPWPDQTKQSAIAGCRHGILDSAKKDYMASNNLTEDQLPPDFHEKITVGLEPFLSVCNCIIEEISSEWSYEYFQPHQDEVQIKMQELTQSGICRPKTDR